MNTALQPLVVVGSVAIDWIITPVAERQHSVGGSAVHFAMAASYFTPVQLVGIVGHDFPQQAIDDLRARGVDLLGLERVEKGLTFRWKGRYHEDMNNRDTLETHLNVFESFSPNLPASYRGTPYVFLANIQPKLQLQVLEQMKSPRVVGLDTMNLWIDIARDDLVNVLRRIDVLVINEEEARMLAEQGNLVRAARAIQAMGPRSLVVKRGEYGAVLFHDDQVFVAPALPLEEVHDPTGAGDSFAGGFMGYLTRVAEPSGAALRTAMIYGSTLASFCVEGFSYDALLNLDHGKINERFAAFAALTDFTKAKL